MSPFKPLPFRVGVIDVTVFKLLIMMQIYKKFLNWHGFDIVFFIISSKKNF